LNVEVEQDERSVEEKTKEEATTERIFSQGIKSVIEVENEICDVLNDKVMKEASDVPIKAEEEKVPLPQETRPEATRNTRLKKKLKELKPKIPKKPLQPKTTIPQPKSDEPKQKDKMVEDTISETNSDEDKEFHKLVCEVFEVALRDKDIPMEQRRIGNYKFLKDVALIKKQRHLLPYFSKSDMDEVLLSQMEVESV